MRLTPWTEDHQFLLQEVLKARVGIPDIDVTQVEGHVVHLDRRETLISPGPRHPYLYLLVEGLLRVAITHENGDEKVIEFFGGGQVVGLPAVLQSRWLGAGDTREPAVLDVLERYRSGPTPFWVRALQPTVAIRLNFEDLETASGQNKAWAQAAFHHLMVNGAMAEARIIELMSLTAETRYRNFVARRGHLMDLVPAKDVASYLGITPEALSRIRARLREADAAQD